MNPELELIRDNLTCAHCKALFKGSDSQALHFYYEKRVVYCSVTCRQTAVHNKRSKQLPTQGPCKTCGKMFSSRKPKPYCCMACYVASDQFKTMTAANLEAQNTIYPIGTPERAAADEAKDRAAAKLRKGQQTKCLECGSDFYQKRSQPKRFCGRSCYRSYLAKRFDRWVANPEKMALPQCYDEFLSQNQLSCLVDGCNWVGQQLSVHMNQTHGVTKREFKRATGFNLKTGVIAKPLAQAFSDRARAGVAINQFPQALDIAHAAIATNPIHYRSLESSEHHAKAFAMRSQDTGPTRVCKGCGCSFTQSTPFGRTIYCTVACRSDSYARDAREGRGCKAKHINPLKHSGDPPHPLR